jgi:putative membrane protein
MILAHGEVLDAWRWAPHFEVWALVAGLGVAYVFAIRKLGRRFVSPGEAPVSGAKAAAFGLGLASLWIFADWPLHEISESYLFSVHMTQHLVFSFIAAPLLLLGTPDWLLRLLLRARWLKALVGRVTRPVFAMLAFNGFLVFSHWPPFVDLSVSSAPFHFSAHLSLMLLSFAMWWPVIGPLAEMPRLKPGSRILYLFLQTVVPTVPASFLTFADTVFYRSYELAPRLTGLSALADQRLSGLIMKLGGGMLLWAVIAVLFFRWSSREDSGIPDSDVWSEVELAVNQEKT